WAEGLPAAAIAAELQRTREAVSRRASELGIRRPLAWTPAMDQLVRDRFGKPGEVTRQIARDLGKTAGAVEQRAVKLGLRHPKFWSPEERAVLRARYGKEPAAGIARDLGRGLGIVYQQAAKLGLAVNPHFPERTIGRYKALHAKGLPDRVIART